MSTDDLTSFRKQLEANPHDFHLMAVYADYLDEQEPQYKRCGHCKGERHVCFFKGPGATNPNWKDCPDCDGAGEIVDPVNALLAEGYRAMALVRPVYDTQHKCWWGWQSQFPPDWWRALGGSGGVEMKQVPDVNKALDEAALAFAKLPTDVKERIRTTGPWAQPAHKG